MQGLALLARLDQHALLDRGLPHELLPGPLGAGRAQLSPGLGRVGAMAAAPLVQVGTRSCTYAVAKELTERLKKHAQVRLEARGKKVSESLDAG